MSACVRFHVSFCFSNSVSIERQLAHRQLIVYRLLFFCRQSVNLSVSLQQTHAHTPTHTCTHIHTRTHAHMHLPSRTRTNTHTFCMSVCLSVSLSHIFLFLSAPISQCTRSFIPFNVLERRFSSTPVTAAAAASPSSLWRRIESVY